MRFTLITAAFLMTTVGAQASDTFVPQQLSSNTPEVLSTACRDEFPDLPKLAARLGIAPSKQGLEGDIQLVMCNGDRYSLFAIVNATLDRLDAASGPKP